MRTDRRKQRDLGLRDDVEDGERIRCRGRSDQRVDVMFAEVQHGVREHVGFLRDFGDNAGAPHGQSSFARIEHLPIFILKSEGENAGFLTVLLE